MFSLNKKSILLSLVGFFLTVYLLMLPHINTINLQVEKGVDIIYTPSHLNGESTWFDDQVKLLPSLQLSRYGQFTGKLGNIAHSDKLYPNVLQEILVTFMYAPIISIFSDADSPYYALPFFVGFIYLMSFYLVRSLGADLVSALTLPIIMIFGYTFITSLSFFILPNGILHPEDILTAMSRIENWAASRQYGLNSFYRIHTLGASYIFFLGYIYFFYKSLKDYTSAKKYMLPMAVVLALQFYCYVFYAIAAGMSFFLAVVWLFIIAMYKDGFTNAKQHVIYLFYSGLIALVLALPSIINLISLMTSDETRDWFMRIGAIKTNFTTFGGNNIIYGFLALFSFFSINNQTRIMSLTLLSTVLLVENSGVLFGIDLQPGHIYGRAVMPVVILFVGCTLYFQSLKIRNKFSKMSTLPLCLYTYRLLVTIVACYFVIVAYNYSHSYAENTYKYQGISTSQNAVNEWLKKRPGSVVATLLPKIAVPLSFHSPSYLYLNFSGHLYQTVSNRDIDNQLVNVFWLFGVSHDQLKGFFDQSQGKAFEKRYDYYYWQRRFYYLDGHTRRAKHLNVLNNMIDNYDVNGEGSLCKNSFDYLIVDDLHPRQQILPRVKSTYFSEAARFGGIVIYELKVENLGCNTK